MYFVNHLACGLDAVGSLVLIIVAQICRLALLLRANDCFEHLNNSRDLVLQCSSK